MHARIVAPTEVVALDLDTLLAIESVSLTAMGDSVFQFTVFLAFYII